MITNTELEKKGNLYPAGMISFEHDQDTVNFVSKNGVLLQVTIMRDNMLRFRYATNGIFENDFSYAIDEDNLHGFNQLQIQDKLDHRSDGFLKLIGIARSGVDNS